MPNILLHKAQFRLADDPVFALGLSRQIVRGKIRNQRTLLMRNHLQPPASIIAKLKQSLQSVETVGSASELLGLEGAAAAILRFRM